MEPVRSHSWNLSHKEAVAIQRDLATHVCTENRLHEAHHVAGIDVSTKAGVATAAIVVLTFPDLEPVDHSVAQTPLTFPYIPGLLAFREGPAVVEAFRELRTEPDVLIFDGQGRAHPRRMGIATHIGVLFDRPSIGCAKSRLCGSHDEPGDTRGSHALLHDGDEIVGAVLRTRTGVKPVYVSIGHKVDLEASLHYVLACCTRFRLPETTRWAHKIAGGEGVPSSARCQRSL